LDAAAMSSTTMAVWVAALADNRGDTYHMIECATGATPTPTIC